MPRIYTKKNDNFQSRGIERAPSPINIDGIVITGQREYIKSQCLLLQCRVALQQVSGCPHDALALGWSDGAQRAAVRRVMSVADLDDDQALRFGHHEVELARPAPVIGADECQSMLLQPSARIALGCDASG